MESIAELSVFPEILYEDNHIIAINKPAGMLSQSDGSDSEDVLTALKAFIKTRDQKPGNVFLGLVHRLDRPVSGAMVLAKTSKAASRLSSAFRQRAVKKIYRSVVEGDATQMHRETHGELNHRLDRDEKNRITRVCETGGKSARLLWDTLKSASHRSWIEVDLKTGLSHQIRAQFAAIGHPIIGDSKYGARQIILGHTGVIALYCHQMTVPHPTRGETINVTAPAPTFWGQI